MKLQIVHIIESFAYGSANSTMLLAKLMAERDHKVSIFYGEREGFQYVNRVEHPNIEWVKLHSAGPTRHLKNILLILRTLRKEPYSRDAILHEQSTFGGLYARMAGLFLRNRVLYSPRGFAFLREDVPFILQKLFWLVEKLMAPLGTTVACGRYEHEIASGLHSSATYVSNGLTLPETVDTQAVGTKIFCAGRICYQKGFDIFKQIAEQNPHLEFQWAGSAADDAGRSLMADMPDNLELLGQIEQSELFDRMREARAILLPSRWEGLSRFLIEAVALGKVVITSDYPGNIDVLENSDSGYSNGFSCTTLSDYKNALEVLQDEELVRNMQAKSRHFAEENFDLNKINNQWIELYES